MRVIVVGGTGLIGRSLAASLTAEGYEVVVLTRAPQRAQPLLGSAQAVAWDGRSAAGWAALADGAGAIINLAGASVGAGRWTAQRKREIAESRLAAGQAVTEAVQSAARPPIVVVQASAVGYYGPRGDDDTPEETAAGSDFLARLCVAWEASMAAVDSLGVRRVTLRTGVVLSREGGALPRMLLPFRLFLGGPLGSGRQWFPWIHIADEIGAIRFLMAHPEASGPFNLAAPHPLTNAEFCRELGRVLRRPSALPVPAQALELLFGEMASILLTGQRALPQRLLQVGYGFQFGDATAALRDLLQ